MSFRKIPDLSVYFIADPEACGGRPVADIVRQAAAGGATMIQLRDKSGAFEGAGVIREILRRFHIPFIINDRVDVARALGADGVHLGQEDMSAAEAREILGPDKIIGVTAFEETHFRNIDPAIVDYAGMGPVYATKTKPDKKILGPEGFERLAALSPVPVAGIGGITPANAGAVIRAGAAGVAMMRAVSESDDPQQAAVDFAGAVAAARSRQAA